MTALHATATTILTGFLTVLGGDLPHSDAHPVPTPILFDCVPYDERVQRYARLILTHEDFRDNVLEAGAEGVDPDSLVAITDMVACAALDSALIVISAGADPAYYDFARYDRGYVQGGGFYFVVEWEKQPEDPWKVSIGPSYIRVFGSDFVMRTRVTL